MQLGKSETASFSWLFLEISSQQNCKEMIFKRNYKYYPLEESKEISRQKSYLNSLN